MNAPIRSVITPVLLLTGLASQSAAETLTVPFQFPTLRAAIAAAVDGDEIVIDDGTYTGPDNRALDALGKAITIRSRNGPTACIFDCQTLDRWMIIASGEGPATLLDGLTIRNGRASTGGALLCSDASPTIRRCVFESDIATSVTDVVASGGAIVLTRCALVISDSTFVRNQAKFGGAIGGIDATITARNCSFEQNTWLAPQTSSAAGSQGGAIKIEIADQECRLVAMDCIFRSNEANSGGAIYLATGELSVSRCSFETNSTGNAVQPAGGAICLSGGSGAVSDSVFRGNGTQRYASNVQSNSSTLQLSRCRFERSYDTVIAQGGSAIVNAANCAFSACKTVFAATAGGRGTAQNCIFANNVDTLILGSGTMSLSNCTLVGNGRSAYSSTGSIAYLGNAGTLAISNSIIWNSRDTPLFTDTSPGALAIRNCIVPGSFGGNNIDQNPRLRAPQFYPGVPLTTFNGCRPMAGSPAIDAGNRQFILPDYTDLDGDGVSTGPTPIDFDGNPRAFDDALIPDSALPGVAPRPDLGAFEYVRPCAIEGDITGDGVVDMRDLGQLLIRFGKASGAIYGEGDLNLDGRVDLADLSELLLNFGATCL